MDENFAQSEDENNQYLTFRLDLPVNVVKNMYKNEYAIRTLSDFPHVFVPKNYARMDRESRIKPDQIKPCEEIFQTTSNVLQFLNSRKMFESDVRWLEQTVYHILKLHARFDELGCIDFSCDMVPELTLNGNRNKKFNFTTDHLFDLIGIISENLIQKKSTNFHPSLSTLIEDVAKSSYNYESDYHIELGKLLRRLYYSCLREGNSTIESKLEILLTNDKLLSAITDGSSVFSSSPDNLPTISKFDIEFLLENALKRKNFDVIESIANNFSQELIELSEYPEGRIMELIQRLFDACDWDTCTGLVWNTIERVRFVSSNKVEIDEAGWVNYTPYTNFSVVQKNYRAMQHMARNTELTGEQTEIFRAPLYYYPPLPFQRCFAQKIEKSADAHLPINVHDLVSDSNFMKCMVTLKLNRLANLGESLDEISSALKRAENPLRLTKTDLQFHPGGIHQNISPGSIHQQLSRTINWDNPNALDIKNKQHLERYNNKEKKILRIIKNINFPNRTRNKKLNSTIQLNELERRYSKDLGLTWIAIHKLDEDFFLQEILFREQLHHSRHILSGSTNDYVLYNERRKYETMIESLQQTKTRTEKATAGGLLKSLIPASTNLFDSVRVLRDSINTSNFQKNTKKLSHGKYLLREFGYKHKNKIRGSNQEILLDSLKTMLPETHERMMAKVAMVAETAMIIENVLQMFKVLNQCNS